MRCFDPATQHPAQVTKVADIPDAVFLNGMTALHTNKKILLIADSANAIVYSLSIRDKKKSASPLTTLP